MRRVLLVDDSKVTREALQAALEPYGFEVSHAENGASALLQLRNAAFDLAFVDLNMPVLDGPNLIRLMRAQGIATKVILVTGNSSTTVLASTIKLGANDYVAKPFSPEAIRVTLARVMGLDPSQLQIKPARVLLQHPKDALAARLRMLLPPHVELTTAVVLAKALEAAEREEFKAVLLDRSVLEGEVQTAAELVRKSQPDAAVFALAAGAAAEAWWKPEGALDGTLPEALDEEVARGFLYQNFLRPLVFVEGSVFHAAGFEGNERNQAAYFAALSRSLQRRLVRQGPMAEPSVDLTRVPPFPGRIAALIEEVRARLDEAGTAVAFRVAPALLEKLTGRAELKRAVVFS
jgi:CheY-like chemotaxis protein